jgi:hypothetical protein
VVFVATCGTHPGVEAMLDMAGLGGDGAQGMDIATADAQPVPAIEVACDKEAVRTTVAGATTTTTTYYFAEVQVPGLDPMAAPHVDALLCNREYYGTYRDGLLFPICPAGSTCTDSGYVPPVVAVGCEQAITRVGPGRVLAFCGYKSATTGGVVSESGYRAKRMFVRVY